MKFEHKQFFIHGIGVHNCKSHHMEILFGLVILFGLWLLGKFFDKTTDELNARNEKALLIQSVSEDPSKIIHFLHQDLNQHSIQSREKRLAENATYLSKYVKEMYLLCQCAQFFVIDRSVVNLQLRGPLISAFKRINSSAYEQRYSSYRDAYLKDTNAIAVEFLKAIDLSGVKVIAIDPTYANTRFNKVCESTRDLLTKAEIITTTKPGS